LISTQGILFNYQIKFYIFIDKKSAKNIAKKGDIVLLSPASASFNIFKNEFDRGDQFVKAVKKLKK
jgi:UDP-N-acetylmuramoylalanine--D-glutamate ligase